MHPKTIKRGLFDAIRSQRTVSIYKLNHAERITIESVHSQYRAGILKNVLETFC